jgi:FkbM family methyltransferase
MNTLPLSSPPETAGKPVPPPTFWHSFMTRLLFKFILPRLRTVKIEGVRLDVSGMSPVMKNNLRLGRYEVQERLLAARAVKKEDVILELGAAIGFIGLYCRKVLGVRDCISVEANPDTLQRLRHNYALNALTPHVIHAAAASEDGELTLHADGDFWENSLIDQGRGTTSFTVPALSLASLVRGMRNTPTVLIADIEGAEQYLDFPSLPDSVRTIIMEVHPSVIGEEAVDRILSTLKSMRFSIRGWEENTIWAERGCP